MLELQNLCFQVSDDSQNQKEIIRDLNLTFENPSLIAITGPNGGGKSTLAPLWVLNGPPPAGFFLTVRTLRT